MGGHHHHGGRRGGWGYPGYGYPIIVEEYIDPEDLIVGADAPVRRNVALHLGTPAPNPDLAAVTSVFQNLTPDQIAAMQAASTAQTMPPPMPTVPTPLSLTPDASLSSAATPPAPAPPPTPVAVVAAHKSLIPAGGALAGGAAGLLVGGPIGAAIGAAIGYFGGKTIDKQTPIVQTAVTPPAPRPAAVHGEFGCWDKSSGWAPHGDERMR